MTDDVRSLLITAREERDQWKHLSGEAAKGLVEADRRFAAHTSAVSDFLNELYAVMVDPCAEGTIAVDEMKRALLAAAVRDREAESQLTALRGALGHTIAMMRVGFRFPDAPGGPDVVPARRVDEWADELSTALAVSRNVKSGGEP